jgi:hypothetical protein
LTQESGAAQGEHSHSLLSSAEQFFRASATLALTVSQCQVHVASEISLGLLSELYAMKPLIRIWHKKVMRDGVKVPENFRNKYAQG